MKVRLAYGEHGVDIDVDPERAEIVEPAHRPLVLAAAVRALGPTRVLAVTAVSESLASGELEQASLLAARLGVRHLTPGTRELENPGCRANGRDRCYFCKSTVLDSIARIALDHGFEHVATGTNADDARDPFRPGIRAGAERGVHTPLRDAALGKGEVRAMARLWGLTVWDKPATPCLASRVRYGLEVTGHRLARIDRAEAAARSLTAAAGLEPRNLRVRDLGTSARLEVDAGLVDATAILPGLREAVAAAGFDTAPLEVEPVSSGRLKTEAHSTGIPVAYRQAPARTRKESDPCC